MADMPLATACDLAESFVTKQVRPFERIREVLVLARDAERLAADADKRKGDAEAAVIRAKDELVRLTTEERTAFENFKAANDAERKRLAAELVAFNNDVAQRMADLEAQRIRANRDHSVFIEKLVREREAAVEEAGRKTAKATKDLEAAEKAYDAFKKKVGMA
jgi:hypothetical protein